MAASTHLPPASPAIQAPRRSARFLFHSPERPPPPLVPRKRLRVRVLRSLADSFVEALAIALFAGVVLGTVGYVVRATARVELVLGPDATSESSTDMGPSRVCSSVPA
jgi:hypothetical protein